ncbi:NUDIX domain-containing protein [Longispora urticae]
MDLLHTHRVRRRTVHRGTSRRREVDVRQIVRRAARAVLYDDEGKLLLIRRTKSNRPVYFTTPGGGIEPGDSSPVDALRRELREELGATADRYQQVLVNTFPYGEGVVVQYFFVCRLVALDMSARHGPEFDDPSRGRYDLARVMPPAGLTGLRLRPEGLTDFLTTNHEALLLAVDLAPADLVLVEEPPRPDEPAGEREVQR